MNNINFDLLYNHIATNAKLSIDGVSNSYILKDKDIYFHAFEMNGTRYVVANIERCNFFTLLKSETHRYYLKSTGFIIEEEGSMSYSDVLCWLGLEC